MASPLSHLYHKPPLPCDSLTSVTIVAVFCCRWQGKSILGVHHDSADETTTAGAFLEIARSQSDTTARSSPSCESPQLNPELKNNPLQAHRTSWSGNVHCINPLTMPKWAKLPTTATSLEHDRDDRVWELFQSYLSSH